MPTYFEIMNTNIRLDLPTYKEFLDESGKRNQFVTDVPFELLSTIRYDPFLSEIPPKTPQDVTKDNFFLFPEHINRMKFTLDFFSQLDNNAFTTENSLFLAEENHILSKLKEAIEQSKADIEKPLRIRLLISKDGKARIELYETAERANLLDGLLEDYPESQRFDVYVDKTPVLASPFTSFKTTHRAVYNEARSRALVGKSPREEVILVNTTSEVMEGSITSIAIKSKQGVWITPKLTSGCLCGITRHFLLKKNLIQEGDIPVDMLRTGRDVLLMNGVMGCVRGTIRGGAE